MSGRMTVMKKFAIYFFSRQKSKSKWRKKKDIKQNKFAFKIFQQKDKSADEYVPHFYANIR
jgi:hypothetical protein